MANKDITTWITMIPALLEIFNNCGSRRRRKQSIREMKGDTKVTAKKVLAAIEMAGDDLPMLGDDMGGLISDLEELAK